MERIIVGDEIFIVLCLLSSVWSLKACSKALFMVIKANSEFLSELVSKCNYLLLAIHMVTYNYFLRLVKKTSYFISGLICCLIQFSGLSFSLFLIFHVVSSRRHIFTCKCLLLFFWPLLKESFRFGSFINFAVVTTAPIHIDSSAVLVAGEFFNPVQCLCLSSFHMDVEAKTPLLFGTPRSKMWVLTPCQNML